MKIKHPIPGVVHLLFPNKREMGLSMARMAEFFESKYDNIRGQYFTWCEFLQTYMDAEGNIPYFNYWEGYNIPSEKLIEFAELFESGADAYELSVLMHRGSYVIATLEAYEEDCYRHELAHAKYYLDARYARMASVIVMSLPERIREAMATGLTREGYDESVHVDEIHAYLKTSLDEELLEMFPEVDLSEVRVAQQRLKVLDNVF